MAKEPLEYICLNCKEKFVTADYNEDWCSNCRKKGLEDKWRKFLLEAQSSVCSPHISIHAKSLDPMIFDQFVLIPENQTFVFEELNSEMRKFVHARCDQLGLIHKSKIISKKDEPVAYDTTVGNKRPRRSTKKKGNEKKSMTIIKPEGWELPLNVPTSKECSCRKRFEKFDSSDSEEAGYCAACDEENCSHYLEWKELRREDFMKSHYCTSGRYI